MRTCFELGRSIALRCLLLGIVTLLLLPAFSPAEAAEDDKQFMIAKGRVTYRVYCINCHGAKAKGDGSLSELLSVKPADLTVIKESNDGTFPTQKVYDVIDGRGPAVRGHGMKEMPVWGDVFQTTSFEPSGTGEEGDERAQRKIWEVVYYLESVQGEPGSEEGEASAD